VLDSHSAFQCVVIAPSGKLLDCKTTSVVFPAHDGQMGILYNHIPMFCKLGLGIMKIKGVPSDTEPLPKHSFLLIDEGLALMCSNLLTIIAQDAIWLHDLQTEKIEIILEKAKAKLARDDFTLQQRNHEMQKLSFLTKLAQISSTDRKSPF